MGTSKISNVVGTQLPNETIAFIDNWRQQLKDKLQLPNYPSRSLILKALAITGLKHQTEALEAIKREFKK